MFDMVKNDKYALMLAYSEETIHSGETPISYGEYSFVMHVLTIADTVHSNDNSTSLSLQRLFL